MSVTTPRPAGGPPGRGPGGARPGPGRSSGPGGPPAGPVQGPARDPAELAAAARGPAPGRPGPAAPARPSARRTAAGASFGALPVGNVVVLEIGAAAGLITLLFGRQLLPVAGGLAAAALLVALLRWRGRWLTQWVALTLGYLFRSHARTAAPAPPRRDAEPRPDEPAESRVIGGEDPRVTLLRLAVPDLAVAHGIDHERSPVGLAWHQGTWTAVLLVAPAPALVTELGGTPNLPLGALAPCLEDRGTVLDSIQVVWHCYPGSTALAPASPALTSYLEVLGPLPAAARRTTWVAVRLDPRRCPAAVRERGGGVVGAHRALIGALSRVRSALERNGVPTRPLGPEELLRAGLSAAELSALAGSNRKATLRERWTGITAGGVGHASYAVTSWPRKRIQHSLNALTGVRALSATVSLAIGPSGEDGGVGLRGMVRVSARTPSELERADQRLRVLGDRLDVTLTPLRGLQIEGFAGTLPFGGSL